MGEGLAIFKEMAVARWLRAGVVDTKADSDITDRLCVQKGYCSDVRGCRVLDSAKKVSMTLRAAGRSTQRLTRVDR